MTRRQDQRRQLERRRLYGILAEADALRERGQRSEADQLEIEAGLREPPQPDEALDAAKAFLDKGDAVGFKEAVKGGDITRGTLMKLHAAMSPEQLQVYDQALVEATPDMDELIERR